MVCGAHPFHLHRWFIFSIYTTPALAAMLSIIYGLFLRPAAPSRELGLLQSSWGGVVRRRVVRRKSSQRTPVPDHERGKREQSPKGIVCLCQTPVQDRGRNAQRI